MRKRHLPDQPEDWNSSPRTQRNDWALGEVDKPRSMLQCHVGVVLVIKFLSDVDHSVLFFVSFSSA